MKYILFCLLFVFGCTGCHTSRRIPNSESALRAKIPLGMHIDQVKEVLSEAKIEHSWVESERKFYGILRDPERVNTLIKEDLSVEILMDKEMRVEKVEIKKVFTGP